METNNTPDIFSMSEEQLKLYRDAVQKQYAQAVSQRSLSELTRELAAINMRITQELLAKEKDPATIDQLEQEEAEYHRQSLGIVASVEDIDDEEVSDNDNDTETSYDEDNSDLDFN